jgi:uncharacterized protein YegL
MRKDLTEIVFILDRSGSMGGLEKDTIGGYNSFLEKQKKIKGEANITTVLFDTEYEVLHDGVDLKKITPITGKEYYVRGSTALLDAIGRSITEIGSRLKNTSEEDKPSKVIFVITTDGYENSSHEYTYAKIKEMITHQQQKYSWEFIFFGANMDAVKEAAGIGIKAANAHNYEASPMGERIKYNMMNRAVSYCRTNDYDEAEELSDVK